MIEKIDESTACQRLANQLAEAAGEAAVDKGEEVIVGVNKYRLKSEDELDILDIGNAAVRIAQIRRIE